MSKERRKSEGDLGTRDALIAATEALLLEEGSAAISSRKIGERAGVKPPLIHYHFDSIDDLYLAVFRRNIEHSRELMGQDESIGALWAMEDDPRVKLGNELTALASHRPALRAELATYAEKARDTLVSALERRLDEMQIVAGVPPVVLAVILSSTARQMRLERALGVTRGHADTEAFLAAWLEQIEQGAGSMPAAMGKTPAPKKARPKPA